ncbi:amine oxidase [Hufsiella ginkgonis]|uniref:amine oxidase n=1 Tax=Hufsiella ginkgonis TaxID=2695274 RepID=UPI001927CA62|nr:amine oxidase [Hufsiella ginkgonis]
MPVKHGHRYRERNPFRSFWMGGYECTDQLNNSGQRVDLLTATQHLERLEADYSHLAAFGIRTVREGIRWSQVERSPGRYDFSVVKTMMDCGLKMGVQQIWDICHFGYPDDLSPLHPRFADRFESLCKAFARFYLNCKFDEPLIVTPINEVSFISWLGGEAAGTVPYCTHQGWQVKYGLMRAYIKGTAALLEADPRTRILTTEPLVNIVPPINATEEQILQAQADHELQFQSLDMLSGRICPELGGKPEYLDILGFNYYYNNQWVLGLQEFLPWANEMEDERWLPLSSLLKEAHVRYSRPIALTETSHPGEDRPHWIRFVAAECATAISMDIPFWGICLYPIIDRPDWDNLWYWHHSGLWDAVVQENGIINRTLNRPYAVALQESRKVIEEAIKQRPVPGIFNRVVTGFKRMLRRMAGE